MEKDLILNLGLGDAFREVKSEETDTEKIRGRRRETQDEHRKAHDEQQFLKLSLHSQICEPEFSNVEESCTKITNAKNAQSIEEVEQVVAPIFSSSDIKSSESQSKNGHQATATFETEKEADGVARKKLRLSRDQAVSLEESFKKHNILNPKQKLVLAKQLHLKPRQVEVWFQNRRARTKLKKTEMDYEYLKRCCHMLTLENRKLQREIAELRMLRKNAATHPYYMPVNPGLCPACMHMPNVSTSASVATVSFGNQPNSFTALLSKSVFGQIVTARQ